MKRELETRLQKASGLLADNRPLKAATPCISKKTLKKHGSINIQENYS